MKSSMRSQKGMASAIGVFVLLVVVGGLVLMALNMSSSGLSDSSQQQNHLQALYLAENALERAVHYLNNDLGVDSDCNNLSTVVGLPSVQTFSYGTAEILGGTYAPVGDTTTCDLTVRGTRNNVVVYITATLDNSGGTGLSGGATFEEHFEFYDPPWTWVPNAGEDVGTISLSTNCPTATCNGFNGTNIASDSSLHIVGDDAGGWDFKRGYLWRNLPTAIDTTGGATSLDWSVGWRKAVVGSSNGIWQRAYIELAGANGGGTTEEIWRHIAADDTNTWTEDEQLGFTLTAGRVYTTIRINIEIRGRGGRQPIVSIDEILLSQGGAGALPNWEVKAWQEIDI